MKKEKLFELYETMLTIRRFEERAAEDYRERRIPGLIHSYIGEEACATGVCADLRRDDRIVSTHRGHGHCIAKGADVRRMMAELYGKSTGFCKGKGGSMHIADFSVGMLGANGIVGGGFGMAAGAALAAQLQKRGGVAVVFFGDGATQEGTFHEGMNLASIWKLPLIFACENNLYGALTPVSYAVPLANLSDRAAAYAMPGRVVDGNDVVAVYHAAREAIEAARAGKGPTFLELKTYRWHAHTEELQRFGDDRPVDEVNAWKKRDPIARMERLLMDTWLATRAELEAINDQVMMRIEDAIRYTLESPLPKPEDALADLFAD